MLNAFRQRAFALKIESTEGTDSTPTAAADAVRVYDGASEVSATEQTRNEDRSTFGGKPFTLTNYVGSITGNVDLIGASSAGTAGPISALLRSCGHTQVLDAVGPPPSAEYNPVSSGFSSATGKFWHAGDAMKLLGGRGMLEELDFSIGSYARARFRFQGSANADIEEALPNDLDLDDWQEPLGITTETSILTVNGVNVDGRSLILRPSVDMATVEHTEARVTRHRDRLTQGELLFFKSAFASLNPDALARGHTIVALSFTVFATGSSKSVKIDVPRAQLKLPRREEVEGFMAYRVPFVALPDNGDDEYLLTLYQSA